MSSYSVVNNVPTFRVSEPFGFTNAHYNMSSSEAATVINDDRLFVSAEFTSWARVVLTGAFPHAIIVCWPRVRVVR